MAMANSDISSMGFTTLYQPENKDDITVDIVFVHGLGGHPLKTWTEFDTLSQKSICWPRDLVPTVCPMARVLTWGYDSTLRGNVFLRGSRLLRDLMSERRGFWKRPILWVAHSLGGIILQQALFMSSDSNDSVADSTAAILFFGTPLKGSTTPVKAIFEALLQSDDAMLDKLEYWTSHLEYCRSGFAYVRQRFRFKIKAFYEMTQHNGAFLVPFQSSILSDPMEDTQALEGDHFQICRFTERSYSWASIIAKDLRYFHILAQALRDDSGVNVRGISGQTALHMAATRGDVASAKMLVPELCADVNLRDDAGRTPLHEAATYGFVEIASILIKRGAGVMVKDKKGQTPLHEASQHGHLNVAELLIKEGADYDDSDNRGVTPLLYAMEKGHESIVQLLRPRDGREGTVKVEERVNDGYNDMDDDPDNLRDNSKNPEKAANKQSSQSGPNEPNERDSLLKQLPTDIADIVSVLPIADVWVSGDQDLSMSNTAKLWVETKTQHRWIWWPLARPKRILQEGEVRIFWRCACGTTLWQETSGFHGELVSKIMKLPDDGVKAPRCAARTKGVGWSTYLGNVVRSPHGILSNTGSSAGQSYEPPASSSQTTTSVSSPAYSDQTSHASGSGQKSQVTPAKVLQSPPTQGVSSQQTAPRRTWILLGTQGNRRTMEPAEIPIDEWTTDYHFFRALRHCYRKHRGKLRLWFSVWRLHYCEVMKVLEIPRTVLNFANMLGFSQFQRLALNHMARDYRDLPTHDDYEYRPKGQDAKNPPISQHMFDVMFNSCDIGCNRMLPHDCFQPPGGVDQLERIPKRVRSFQRDMTAEIWGLNTVHNVSFAYVSFYHCLMVIGPLIFYACWMKTFPQDLQNASVPISLVLGALSMFWSSCGILTSNNMD